MTSFIDNWNLYSIGSTSVNLSEEEAVVIALDAAREHSWTMQLDEDTLDPRNFNEKKSVSWTTLIFDGSLDANKARSEDVLELYPVWRVGLVLNKVYGELYGIKVDIWADTKEVRSVTEEYSQLAAQWFENNTANVGTTAALAKGAEQTLVVAIMVSVITLSAVGVFATSMLKKNQRALNWPKPRLLKICGILIGFLLLLVFFSPLVTTANATSRAGNVWAARSSGATNYPHSDSWRKQDDEIDRQLDVAQFIKSYCFTTANGYTGFDNKWSDKVDILSQAAYLNNYDYVAIVDFDHGVGGYPGRTQGYPNVPYDEQHYMFEDDYGTIWGTPAEYFANPPESCDEHTDWSHGVYDIDIYNAFPPAKVHFAFIDACQSANLYRLYQGFYPATGNPVGLPFAFTHREVSYFPPTGTQMSNDGYSNPDPFPQCYIGFPEGSAALAQRINRYGEYETGQYWYIWVVNFFYLALNCDISVKDALDMTSYLIWQCEGFYDSPLTGSGFTAVWPMDCDGDGEFEDYTGGASTLAVYGNANIHLKNFQPPDYVTAPSMISGPNTGLVDVSYQFSASAIDSHGHILQYRFDWGDGSPYDETGWYPNGVTAYENHSWSSAGWFNVKVQARCPNTGWSSWSNPTTINIQNGPIYHWLHVAAIDDMGCLLNPNIYIDDVWVGTGCVGMQVVEGWHSILVDDPTWNDIYNCESHLQYFTDYYGNGEDRPIYSNTLVYAVYHTGP